MTIGAASTTPLIDSAWNRVRSSSVEGSSKHFVPGGMIHRSAEAWSIIVVTIRPNPK
jgi:hypothetical protein